MAGLSTSSTTVVGSAEITNNSIVNEDINTAAAIDATKLADGTVTSVEFQYINTLSSNAQTQITANLGTTTTHIANATGAHAASAIASTPSGNLAAIEVQAALNELQTDVDTRLVKASNLSDLTSASTARTNLSLGNVDNTSDVTKNAASVTLTNKALSDSTTSIVDVADATKKILFDAGGTTVTTTTITAAQTANRVVTLPDATDTLMGKATTDTLTNKTFDADGTGNSISNIENADIKAAAAIALNKLAAATASRALVSDASGFVSPATTTSTEIGYVNGVTSAIQTQLNTAAPMTTGGDLIYGGASGVPTRLANGTAAQYLKSNGTTLAPSWATFTTPTVQTFLSGSGTYTTPANVKWIQVKMVGGGGGGSGSGTASGGSGGNGGNTTFGTALLAANGGSQATWAGASAAGGTASLGTGPIGIALAGNTGGAYTYTGSSGVYAQGTAGAASPFGGSGAPVANAAAINSVANTGSGGGGAGTGVTANSYSGNSGASGGYVDAIIAAPSATYAYAVGAAGTAGTAGTAGYAGGAGGSGVIIVTEFYQ